MIHIRECLDTSRRGRHPGVALGPWILGAALLTVPALPLRAAPDPVDPDGSVSSLLERFPAEERERRTSDWYEPLAAVEALYSLFRSPTPPTDAEDAAWRLAEGFDVAPPAGRAILEATLCYSALSSSEGDWEVDLEDRPAVDAYLQPCYEKVLASLRQAPDLPAVRELVAWTVESFGWRITGGAELLAAKIAALPGPAPLALDLARRLAGVPHARLVQLAIDRLGPHPAVLVQAVADTDDPVFRAAAYEAASEELRARASRGLEPAPPEVETFVARQWLWVLLQAGLTDEARRALALIPDDLRRALAEAPAAPGDEPLEVLLDGLPLRAPAVDLRIPLAALFATGHDPAEPELAREILAASRAGATGSPDEALGWQVLERLVGPPNTEDPFGLLTEIAALVEEGPDRLDPIETGTFLQATAELASDEGYPEVAAYLLEVGRRRLTRARLREVDAPVVELSNGERIDLRSWTGMPVFPPEIEARVEELGGTVEREAERLDDRRAAVENDGFADPAAFSGDAASVAARVERLLAPERWNPFVEKPLPPGVEPVGTGNDAKQIGAPPPLPAGLTLPEGFHAVRAELRGREAVAVSTSQDYDPVGEVTAGGYWVMRSHDGGATWSEPLYTGLRVNLPYVVRPASDLPLLDGQTLRMEVEVREIDPDRIAFPPVMVRYERQETGLYLEASWADLERDGDGDGLTDLAEERLVTDPEDPDSDGDGLADGVDPLPQVPATAPASGAEARRSAALLVALARIAGGQEWAILPRHGPEGEALPGGPGNRPALTDERTLFLRADRQQLRSLQPDHRVVVLTSDELARYREKFGLTFASRVRLMSFDRESRRGFVIWSASWAWGSFRLEERDDGGWDLIPISSWVT